MSEQGPGPGSLRSCPPEPVYILGAGMHPWGKWGRDFTEYGVVAGRAALRDAGLDWRQIQLVAGADTIRNGYPGFVAGATFAQKLGWTGIPVSSTSRTTYPGTGDPLVPYRFCPGRLDMK